MRFVESDDDRIVGMEIDRIIESEDFDLVWNLIEQKILRHKKLTVYAAVKNFIGVLVSM